jgi:DHA2 family methylenomycin A resistance protein-like MFS transporter
MPRGRRLTLAATSLGWAVVQLDVSVVNVAIHAIGRELGGGTSGLQWVVNAYTIGLAAFILTAGSVADRLGARRMFVTGSLVFVIASAACGAAPTLGVLIAARAIQGIGAAMLVPASLTLLNHTFTDPRTRARAFGLWTAGASFAMSAGPLVGGLLIAAAGWRAIFFINVPLVLAGIVLAVTNAPETTRTTRGSIDWAGQVLGVAMLSVLVAATIEGGVRGFGSTVVLAGFAVAVITGAAFVAVEARGRTPMLPLGVFASPTFSVSVAIGALLNLVVYGLVFVLSLLFQREQGHGPLLTGVLLLPMMAGITIANLVSARQAARLGRRGAVAVGAALVLTACAGLLGVGRTTPYGAMAVQLAALGFGLGSVIPIITAELMASVDRERSGVASGTLNSLRQTGSAIGVALFGALIGGSHGFFAGAHLALWIAVGLTAVVLALTPGLGPPHAPAEPDAR